MGERSGEQAVVLLDACCLLNLYATRCIEQILRTIPARFAVARAAAAESLYVCRGGSGDDADERDPVDLRPLVAAGLLDVWEPEDEAELATYVDLAAALDDREAMTCALAIHRRAEVATDDRKALRVLRSGPYQVTVRTTTSLIKAWAEACSLDPAAMAQALVDVRERARFTPGQHDPLYEWWQAIVRGA